MRKLDPKSAAHRFSLISAQAHLARVYGDLGEQSAARKNLEEAAAAARALVQDDPTPDHRLLLAATVNTLGNLRRMEGDLAPAETLLLEAAALAEELTKENHRAAEYQSLLATIDNNLAVLARHRGDVETAQQRYTEAIAIRARLMETHPDVLRYQRDLGGAYVNLGVLRQSTGDTAGGVAQFLKALELFERLAKAHPAVSNYREVLAKLNANLGVILNEAGDPLAANDHYRRAVQAAERLVEENPEAVVYRYLLGGVYNNLGDLLRDQGDLRGALEQFRQALAERKTATTADAVPEYWSDLAVSHDNLGLVLAELGEYAEAERHHQQALEIYERLAKEYEPSQYAAQVARTLNHLGAAHARQDEHELAETFFRRAVEQYDKLPVELFNFPNLLTARLQALSNLAVEVEKTTGLDAALEAHRQAAEASPTLLGDDVPPTLKAVVATVLNNQGNALRKQGRFDEAVQALAQAIAVRRRLHDAAPAVPAYQLDLAHSLVDRGLLMQDWGRHAEALTDFHAAAEVRPDSVDVLSRVAVLLAACPDDAIRDGEEAMTTALHACRLSDDHDPECLAALAAAHAEQGDFAAAVERQTQALDAASADRQDEHRRRLELYREGRPLRLTGFAEKN